MTRADERKLKADAQTHARRLWLPDKHLFNFPHIETKRATVVKYLYERTGMHVPKLRLNGLTDVQLHDIIAVCKSAPKRADGTLDWEG